MAYIEWQDWMTVGVPMVDADHRVLISLLNQVHECLGKPEERANLGSVLASLCDYTDYHFKREEKLQEEVGYPGLELHHKMHERLTGQVVEINNRYKAQPDSVRGIDVLTFLERWLIDHILTNDMAFRPYALGNPEAEAKAIASISLDQLRGEHAKPFDWHELSVLVIDDNQNFLTLMDTIMTGIGTGSVMTANTAAEGIDLLSRQGVDIVVVDRYMTGMDGFDFISQVRNSSDPLISGVGILMISGRGDEATRTRAAAVGADDFLEKPLSARMLLQTMAKIVAKHHE